MPAVYFHLITSKVTLHDQLLLRVHVVQWCLLTVWSIWHTVSYPLSHTSHSKYGGWRHFVFIVSDGLQQTLGRVIQSHLHVTVPLSVSCPQHNHLHNRNTLYHSLVKEGSPPSYSISCKGLKVYSNKQWPPLASFLGSPLTLMKTFSSRQQRAWERG